MDTEAMIFAAFHIFMHMLIHTCIAMLPSTHTHAFTHL